MDCSMPVFPVHHQLLKLDQKFMSVESVMPSNHLTLCSSLLLLPSIFPSIRVFSNESALHIRWPNEYSGLMSFRTDWLISLLSKGLSRVFTSTTIQNLEYIYVNITHIKIQAVPIPKNATSINTAPKVTIVLISTTTN